MTAKPDPSRRTATPTPKTLRYAETLRAVEGRIAEALPEIIDGLIARAKDGDVKAALYLTDRILGRVASLDTPPAEDRRTPYTEADFLDDQRMAESLGQFRKLLG